jgi:D-alanyl-lipoteichoic acid acyltransferase DltB (MBOAT superfamily)
MTFTSGLFLIGILPFFAIIYNCFRTKKPAARKTLLFFINALYLLWGGTGSFLFLCAFSLAVSFLAFLTCKYRNKVVLAGSVLLTVAPLLFFKYTRFVIETINSLTGFHLTTASLFIPTGISFVTFEALSLLIDLYKGSGDKAPSPFHTWLYLCFFPTVTSGPIIQYSEFEKGLLNPGVTEDYTTAIERIAIGLAKKTLVADKLSLLVNYYFDGVAVGSSYSCPGLWISSIAYTLQLYFDFSGYSDMAVGIGELLGFRIRENFNKPYQAYSISDFWKRWHISLTRWFRDYIYIPLGGNRCPTHRRLANMLTVWLLTGIWHGADWSFLVWGIGYFLLLVSEKYLPLKFTRTPNPVGRIYTLFFVNLLWVPFRAGNLATARKYLAGMFGGGNLQLEEKAVHFLPLLTAAILLCFPWEKIFRRFRSVKVFSVARGFLFIALVCWAVCSTTNAAYAPYIYGNF